LCRLSLVGSPSPTHEHGARAFITVFFRLRPKNIPEVILDAHLLLSILTVAILATITVLAQRKS
jgi:hypothetical protein